ncbi:lipopolysaccharide assembly protein LapA domain-containing protein [Pseudomonas sp. JQ36]
MRRVKSVILTVLFLVIALICFAFVLENQNPIKLTLFGWGAPDLPASLVVILALLLGMAIGPVLALGVVVRRRRVSSHRHGVTEH